jgi:hypothetical protein
VTRIEFGHPLYGAELRLARARRLIGTMNRQYQQWANAHKDSGWNKRFEKETGNLTLTPAFSGARHVYVPRISITLGETAYNVRSALDYLVYSIARASNRGIEVSGIQFPIEDSDARYWMRWTGKDPKSGRDVPKWLNKIPKDVADNLAHCQPFSHCRWAELLRDISNPDKHRHLTTLNISNTFISDRPVLGVIDTKTNRHTFHLRGQIEVGVSLQTGEDIIDAAKLVESEARALVRSYAGRFKLPPPGFV